jgi:hypothetical protein
VTIVTRHRDVTHRCKSARPAVCIP